VNIMHYLGLDVHKKTISYCLRQADGTIVREGTIEATREALSALLESMPRPWSAGLEATMFSAWIYDHIRTQGGGTVKVAHSTMLRAIAAGKRKNDRLDARKIADLLRCDYFRSVTWLHGRSVTGAACCGIETCWYAKQCG
jgi:transposase